MALVIKALVISIARYAITVMMIPPNRTRRSYAASCTVYTCIPIVFQLLSVQTGSTTPMLSEEFGGKTLHTPDSNFNRVEYAGMYL